MNRKSGKYPESMLRLLYLILNIIYMVNGMFNSLILRKPFFSIMLPTLLSIAEDRNYCSMQVTLHLRQRVGPMLTMKIARSVKAKDIL